MARTETPLLAAICHDLRAPLAAVTMGANFVLQTTPETEASGRSRRIVQAMLRSCKQMERLIRDFGELSEIENGTLALRSGLCDSTELLELAAKDARALAHDRNLDVRIDLAPPPTSLMFRCDRERLLRVLGHVLDNALRFAPAGTPISVAVIPGETEVAITVTDHGPGIPTETYEHLYDRAWHTRAVNRTGPGVGLAIARGVLEAHKGRVDVVTRPGNTVVTLTLPAAM